MGHVAFSNMISKGRLFKMCHMKKDLKEVKELLMWVSRNTEFHVVKTSETRVLKQDDTWYV